MSEFHLNNPDFDPSKIQPIQHKFKNGMQREEHERIVKAGLEMMGLADDKRSDIEILLAKAIERISTTRNWAHTMRQAHIDNGWIFLPSEMQTKLLSKYWQSMESFDKEELLMILSTFLTQQTMKEVA